jgi:chemotaxis protein MotA
VGTLIFLLVGLLSLIFAFVIEGGHLAGLLVDTAAMIVFGGTLGAVGVSFPWENVRSLPKVIGKSFRGVESKATELILYFVDISNIARKEGILALERVVSEQQDLNALTRTGLRLAVDGTEPQLIKEILHLYIDNRAERHHEGIAMLEAAGGFAPTMGIIGTVMGLVHVLSNLSDPGSLGPAIAVAFIATLYGVGSANLIWLPIAGKLKAYDAAETKEGEMIVEAVLLVAQGVSPRMVEEKLITFLNPKQLETFTSMWEPKESDGKAA